MVEQQNWVSHELGDVRQYETLMVAIPGGIVITAADDAFTMLFINQGYYNMVGRPSIGQPCSKAYRGRQTPCVDCPAARLEGERGRCVGRSCATSGTACTCALRPHISTGRTRKNACWSVAWIVQNIKTARAVRLRGSVAK